MRKGLFIHLAITLLGSSLSLLAFQASAAEWNIDREWAELPEGGWGGATSWVATDGKGGVLVMVRTVPYFRLFSRDGKFIRSWGDDELFRNAHSVTFDREGNVWATDAAEHVIYKYNAQGEIVLTLGEKGVEGDNASTMHFNQVNHLTFAPDGDIYVTDGYVNSRVVHFNADGTLLGIIGGVEGAGNGQFSVPHGIAVDSTGRILVNDSGNQRVSVFDANGKFIENWAYPSRGGIIVTEDDTVYISDVNAGAVNIVKDGELIDSIPVDARPHGLAVDTDGSIYASDARGQLVMKITRK
jgi:peptidylamidoglycolate lyase